MVGAESLVCSVIFAGGVLQPGRTRRTPPGCGDLEVRGRGLFGNKRALPF